MKKSFTILSILICMVLAFNVSAQQGNSTDQKGGSRLQELARRNPSMPSLFFSKAVLLANGYTEEQLNSDFKVTADGLYQPIEKSEKLEELNRAGMQTSVNPADATMQMLPKVKQKSNFEETVSEYHNLLEEVFAQNPSLLSNLGIEFEKAYNSPELFREVVKTVLDKGHTIK